MITEAGSGDTVFIGKISRLRESHQINYQLTDLKGKTVLKGRHQGLLVNIDLHHLQSGIYALTLTLTDQQRREQETLKIIKQ